LTVKRLIQRHEQLILASENSDYPDILIREDFDLVIWGVVTNVIHAL
ncbi:MAG: DNA polymerase V, partial [Methylococcales bacterium]|nr:DNA polymerase V [Methylococcales bacterium]MBT7968610.1 DNA polymerase V [Methylococcales bacterium]